MTVCDLDSSVPDWIIEHPETMPVFRELGIDSCCGGKSLAYACREQGLAAKAVLERLYRSLKHENPCTSSKEEHDGNPPCKPGRGY